MSRLYHDRRAAAAAAEKLKVYAQPQRLMILSSLLDKARNVGEIAEATGIGQPALSQQLAQLRRAGLVATRKDVKQVWYALADEGVAQCVRTMEAIFHGADPAPPPAVPAITAPTALAAVPAGVAGFARVLRS
jgi:DNA-binding transcriptional ArsR family regulator